MPAPYYNGSTYDSRPGHCPKRGCPFPGKLLGDVIRTYGGDALLDRIEAIRAASVDRFRGIANPRGLAAGWESLSLDETVAFVRSFMLFSMLANLAEDRQGAAAEKDSTLASALAFLEAQGVDAAQAAPLARSRADYCPC